MCFLSSTRARLAIYEWPILGCGYTKTQNFSSVFQTLTSNSIRTNTGVIYGANYSINTSQADLFKSMKLDAAFGIEYGGSASTLRFDSALSLAEMIAANTSRVGLIIKAYTIVETKQAVNDQTSSRIRKDLLSYQPPQLYDFIGQEYVNQIQFGSQLYINIALDDRGSLNEQQTDLFAQIAYEAGNVRGKASVDFEEYFREQLTAGTFEVRVFAQGGAAPSQLNTDVRNAVLKSNGTIADVSAKALEAVRSYLDTKASVDRRVIRFSTIPMATKLAYPYIPPTFTPKTDLIAKIIERYTAVQKEKSKINDYRSTGNSYFGAYASHLAAYQDALVAIGRKAFDPLVDPQPNIEILSRLITDYEDRKGFVLTELGPLVKASSPLALEIPNPKFFSWVDIKGGKIGPRVDSGRTGTSEKAVTLQWTNNFKISSIESGILDPDAWIELSITPNVVQYLSGGWSGVASHFRDLAISPSNVELSFDGALYPISSGRFNGNNLIFRARDIIDKNVRLKMDWTTAPGNPFIRYDSKNGPGPIVFQYRALPSGMFSPLAGLETTLKILSPNGLGAWPVDEIRDIYWSSNATNDGNTVRIELWRNGVRVQTLLSAAANFNHNSVGVKMPVVADGPGYKIRVVSPKLETLYGASDPRVFDDSDSAFNVVGSLHVLKPGAGDSFSQLAEIIISWSSVPAISGNSVRVELWKDGSKIHVLDQSAQNIEQNSSNYSLPGPATSPVGTGYTVRIVSSRLESSYGVNDPRSYGESAVFSIK